MENEQYIIISVNHNNRNDKYILLWNPDNAGYTFREHRAGRYEKNHVLSDLYYYNSGSNAIAVTASIVEELATEIPEGYFGADIKGKAVLNNVTNWKTLLKHVIAPPLHETKYQCKYSKYKEGR